MSIATPTKPVRKAARVGIVGGGLAGLATACALAEDGYQVTLFERRAFLGGRACSYDHPPTGEVVDNCQHVLLGCCTNLRDFYSRLGSSDKIRWYDKITFMEPGGRTSAIASTGLPAPMHSGPSFAAFSLLSLRDKIGIARALLSLLNGVPEESDEDFLSWLRRKGQTQRAIDRFWAPVTISSLNEELDRCSVKYSAMVFRDAFLKSAEASWMGVPLAPLSEIYGLAESYIRERGGDVLLRSTVEEIVPGEPQVTIRSNGVEHRFDFAVSAVPFHALGRLLPPSAERERLLEGVEHLRTVPITGIHLWFDREITPLEHASLLDRNIQWMFQKSKIVERHRSEKSYIELVISSSRQMLEMSREEIIALALKELGEFFPAVHEAKLEKFAIIKEVHATFAPEPNGEQYRPVPQSEWPRLLLSGDWTRTGWPATMEGAVRSGYLTAEAVARAAGETGRFLVPDLPARGLMRLFRP